LKIAHIKISRFRGIRSLSWSPGPHLNCLIGPGDSSKTTILDAIEIGLSPRYGFSGTDADFYDCDFTNPVEIITTLIDLPDDLVSENRYGLLLRGWHAGTQLIHDEKESDDSEALSVRAVLEPETLEWSWSVYNDRIDQSDPPLLKLKDGNTTSPARLGPYADRHLTWARNSTLTRMVKAEGVTAELVRAHRSTKAGFDLTGKPSIEDAIARAQGAASRFAVRREENYSAKLDVQSIAVSSGAVSLHEGDLPLRTLGTGSSRLLVAGIQHDLGSGRILLVDEVEHGLEPHRIHRLLGLLRDTKGASGEPIVDGPPAQVFMTTHSPVVLRELAVGELFTVRRNTAGIEVNAVGAGLKADTAQGHVRSNPEAFLAPRILVCEGRTEVGLMRSLDVRWSHSSSESLASMGVAIVDGGGRDPSVELGIHLAQLGYGVCVMLDTDKPISASQRGGLTAGGCTIAEWTDSSSTESRVFCDLPISGVRALVTWATEKLGEPAVIRALNATKGDEQAEWSSVDVEAIKDNAEVRRHLAKAAEFEKKNDKGKTTHRAWFKSIYGGEAIGNTVFDHYSLVEPNPLGLTLNVIRKWIDE
jgi:putative ATP-dependent endonuclease of the OLD family